MPHISSRLVPGGECAPDAGFPALELQEVQSPLVIPSINNSNPSEGYHQDWVDDFPSKLGVAQEEPLLNSFQNLSTRTESRANMKASKITRLLDKLAVDSEPGLKGAQLMLANHDLKPGNA